MDTKRTQNPVGFIKFSIFLTKIKHLPFSLRNSSEIVAGSTSAAFLEA